MLQSTREKPQYCLLRREAEMIGLYVFFGLCVVGIIVLTVVKLRTRSVTEPSETATDIKAKSSIYWDKTASK